jgi:hypothetical protein
VESNRTVWDGVYTAAQAERGKRAFEQHCSLCHNSDLSGGTATALSGDRFLQGWAEDNLGSLYRTIRSNMPFGAAGTLSDQTYLDVLTYILKVNTFPAGPEELELNAGELRDIRIQDKERPGVVPNFAMVKVIGCLEQGSDRDWRLVRASEPVRAREPDNSTDRTNGGANLSTLGALTFQLLNVYPTPDWHTGRKVEIRGLLIRASNDTRINVVSLVAVSPACGP